MGQCISLDRASRPRKNPRLNPTRRSPVRTRLTSGAKRIRTLGPRYIDDGCETVLGAWCLCAYRPERPTRSQGGPTVRIRLPPAVSPLRILVGRPAAGPYLSKSISPKFASVAWDAWVMPRGACGLASRKDCRWACRLSARRARTPTTIEFAHLLSTEIGGFVSPPAYT